MAVLTWLCAFQREPVPFTIDGSEAVLDLVTQQPICRKRASHLQDRESFCLREENDGLYPAGVLR